MITGRNIALFAARTGDDKKATDIVVYDLRGMTDVTDYFVIMTASSRSQIRAITESIRRELKSCGVTKLGQEGTEGGQWVLMDYSDCVIHVFSPELREYYGLESLWGDAPRLEWAEEAAPALQRLA